MQVESQGSLPMVDELASSKGTATQIDERRARGRRSRRRKPAQQPGLTPQGPPRFAPGQQVVVYNYDDGWRWTIVDAIPALPPCRDSRRRESLPAWLYTVEAVRPYDAKTVRMRAYEWRFRPLPDAWH